MRFMRAPTIFGRAWISAPSVIGVGPLAQRIPLRGVVAANYSRTALFDAVDLERAIFSAPSAFQVFRGMVPLSNVARRLTVSDARKNMPLFSSATTRPSCRVCVRAAE